jgi:hypothetical protein
VALVLFLAARRLWVAGVHVLAAFVRFLGVLVYTLPTILIAGCIALAGMWVINNLNLSSLPALTMFEGSSTGSPNHGNDRQSGQTTASGVGETTGSKQ